MALKEDTYTEMREELLSGGTKSGRIPSKAAYTNAPTEIEMQKMQEWKKREQELDNDLEEVIDGIKRWKQGLKETGELIDESDRKIEDLTNKVESVNESLF